MNHYQSPHYILYFNIGLMASYYYTHYVTALKSQILKYVFYLYTSLEIINNI